MSALLPSSSVSFHISSSSALLPILSDVKQQELQDALVTACENGDLTAVQITVKSGAKPNAVNSQKKQPLGAAVWGMNPEIVRFLTLLSTPNRAVMTWQEIEEHNRQYPTWAGHELRNSGTWAVSEFKPTKYGDWHPFLEKFKQSAFLCEIHVTHHNLRPGHVYTLETLIAALKKELPIHGSTPVERCGDVNYWKLTESRYVNNRREIRTIFQDLEHTRSFLPSLSVSRFDESKEEIETAKDLVREQRSLNPVGTKGGGDCPFHAVLGAWNEEEGIFLCVDVDKKREQVREAIRTIAVAKENSANSAQKSVSNSQNTQKSPRKLNLQPTANLAEEKSSAGIIQEDSQLYKLSVAGIKGLIMAGTVIGEVTENLLVDYQGFLTKKNYSTPEHWNRFEEKLRKHEAIMQCVEKYGRGKNLRDKFYNALNKTKAALYEGILSIRPLHQAFYKYNELAAAEYFWNITPETFHEYAEFVGKSKQWLLPHELEIIAFVFNITVIFYPCSDALPETFNEGQKETVSVQFNGRDHYERLVAFSQGEQLEKLRASLVQLRESWAKLKGCPQEVKELTPPAPQGVIPLAESRFLGNLASLQPLEAACAVLTEAEQQQFLNYIVQGEQDRAETLLRSKPVLAEIKVTVTDLSKREFKDITAFQYAVWALDWQMWRMLLKYMNPQLAAVQLQELENTGTAHGKRFSLTPLIETMNTFLKKLPGWGHSERQSYWCGQVGNLQLLLPAHVAQEYCHPKRTFSPCPEFNEKEFMRSDIAIWYKTLSAGSSGYVRGTEGSVYLRAGWTWDKSHDYWMDLDALQTLSKIREGQFEKLKLALSHMPLAEELEALKPLQEGLVKACEQGDLKAVQALIAQGARPNVPTMKGKQPLGAAVWGMNPEIVRLLTLPSTPNRAAMTWQEIEEHNRQYTTWLGHEEKPNGLWAIAEFKPKIRRDWRMFLIALKEKSPFLSDLSVKVHTVRSDGYLWDVETLIARLQLEAREDNNSTANQAEFRFTESVYATYRQRIKEIVHDLSWTKIHVKPLDNPVVGISVIDAELARIDKQIQLVDQQLKSVVTGTGEDGLMEEQLELQKSKQKYDEKIRLLPLQQELVVACEQGDEKAVHKLINEGVEVDQANWQGKLPLGAAIWGMNPAVVDMLLQQKSATVPMTWAQCEEHNREKYGEVFLISTAFNPPTFRAWCELLDKIEPYLFIRDMHFETHRAVWGDSHRASASWSALKKHIAVYINDSLPPRQPGYENRQDLTKTETQLITYRAAIKQAVEKLAAQAFVPASLVPQRTVKSERWDATKWEKFRAEEIKHLALFQDDLVKACERGQVEEVKVAIARGAKPYYPNAQGKQPLAAAAWGMNPEVIDYLLSQEWLEPPMAWAACQQHNREMYQNIFYLPGEYNPPTILNCWEEAMRADKYSPFICALYVKGYNIAWNASCNWEELKNMLKRDSVAPWHPQSGKYANRKDFAFYNQCFSEFRNQVAAKIEQAHVKSKEDFNWAISDLVIHKGYVFELRRSGADVLTVHFTKSLSQMSQTEREQLEPNLAKLLSSLKNAIAVCLEIMNWQYKLEPNWSAHSLTISAAPEALNRIANLLQEVIKPELLSPPSLGRIRNTLFYFPVARPGQKESAVEVVGCRMQ